jgi:Ni,Fe-hydrogenase III small subunit
MIKTLLVATRIKLLLGIFLFSAIISTAQNIAPGSVIATNTQNTVLAGWLPNFNGTLLYRRSVDGASSTSFHNKCDNKGATVVLIKTIYGTVFGGYNPNFWTTNGQYSAAPSAFIFNLTTAQKAVAGTYFGTQNPYATFNYAAYGPTFGGGHDINIASDMNTGYVNTGYSYGTLNGTQIGSVSAANALAGPGFTTLNLPPLTEIEVYAISNIPIDATPPVITCPTNTALASCENLLPNYTSSAIVTDNSGSSNVTVTQSPLEGTAIAYGATVTITLTAKDASGNSSQCSFTVTKGQNITPVAQADAATVCAGQPVTFSVLDNDTHPQGLVLTISDFTQPAQGLLVKNANNTFTYTPITTASGPITFTYTTKANDNVVPFTDNNHYYEFVPASGITWAAAKAAAEQRTYNGLKGYLVTITSSAEQAFVQNKLQGAGWLGASDLSNEGTWRWVTGPEGKENNNLGRIFSNQLKNGDCSAGTGQSIGGNYLNWAGAEPNDCGGPVVAPNPTDINRGGEHYAHFISGNGQWNDFPNDAGSNIQGYVVEYGGLENCTPALTATATVTINVNPLAAAFAVTGGGSYCAGGAGVVIGLSNSVTGVSYQLKNGTSFVGAPLPGTGSALDFGSYKPAGNYSVLSTVVNTGCLRSMTGIAVVSINALPTATITAGGATTFCQGGNVVLTASAGSSYKWYNNGTLIPSATSSTYTAITSGNYTVEVTNAAGCSATSVATIVTVNALPVVAAIQGAGKLCVAASTQLTNTTTGGTWASSNTAVATVDNNGKVTGVSVGTANITYTVSTNGCATTVTTGVVVNVAPVAAISANGPLTFCEGGNVILKSAGSSLGNALAFNGTTGYVNVNSTSTISNLGLSGYTLEAWVYPANVSGVRSILRKTSDYNLYIINGSIAAEVWPMGAGNSTWIKLEPSAANVLTNNTWAHIAATWNKQTGAFKLYINGIQISTVVTNGNIGGTEPLLIGKSSIYDQPFIGKLDEVRIWNTERSATEVADNRNMFIPSNTPNLVAYYKFDEANGTTTSDATGNGNNGTLLTGTTRVIPSDVPVTYSNYTWSNNATTESITVNQSGNYTLTVRDANGCTATSAPTTVTVNTLPVVTASSNSPVTAGSTLNLSATGASSYAWTGPNGFVSGTPASISNVTASANGIYTVTGTDANNCKATATTTVVVNTPATGLELGTNGYVSIPNNSNGSLDFGNSDFTVEVMTKKNGASNGYLNSGIVSKWNTGAIQGTNEWALNNTANGSDNIPSFLIETSTGIYMITGNSPMTIGTWYHLAVVRSGTSLKMYVNGVLQNNTATIPANATIPNRNMPVIIGGYRFNSPAEPIIYSNIGVDELRIWKRALCVEEINNSRTCEIVTSANALSALYHFNQGNVNANNTGINSLTDATANNNNGSLNNFALNGATSNWAVGNASGNCAVFVAPAATIGGFGSPVCQGRVATLTASIPGGTWSSSNPSAVTIDPSTGVLTAVTGGSTIISYTTLCGRTTSTPTLTVTPSPVVPTYSGITTICKGGSTTITVSHPDPTATFGWCNNVSSTNTLILTDVQFSTTYCVEARVNGCSSAQIPVAITMIQLPTFTATKTDVNCAGGNDGRITITSSNANQYSIDNGATFVSTNTFTGLTAGNYNVVVRSAAGCISTAQVITVATIPDVTKPVPTVTTLPVITGQCAATVTTVPTATDNCSGSINGTTTSPLVYTTQGTYTITWSYKDAAGNIQTQTQTVIVKDDTKPVITAPGNVVVTLANGCSTTVTVPEITVTDNCQNPPGSALNFDGVNDQVAVANGLPSMNEMTIETWLNPKRISNWDVIMNYNSFGTGDVHFQFVPDGRLEFSIAGNNPIDQFTSATFSSNQWYHFAAVYSATGKYVKFYLNGNLIDTRTYTTAISTSNGVPFTIGNWAGQRPFEGDLDDLRIWNVAKTDVQIKADMNKTLIGSEIGLLAYYNFNQGVACANNSSNQTLTDLKGLRNGTLQNFDLSAASCNSNWTNGAPTTGITVTNDRTNSSNASGIYPVGNTQITWTATDAAGNISTATQVITVLAPEANITGNNITIADGATSISTANNTDMGQTFPGIAIVKNFTIENNGTAPLTVSSVNISGASSFIVNGITLPITIAANSSATFNVQFLSNTVGIANAVVTVNNNDCDEAAYNFAVKAEINCTVPVFNNINVYLQQSTAANGCNATVTYPLSVTGIPAPAITYTFSGATVRTGSGTGSGEAFNKGVTHVIVSAANACGTRTAEFDVTVVDDVPPVVRAKSITVPLSATGTATITPSMIDNGSTDNCGPVTLSMTGSGTLCGIAGENGFITITAPVGAVIDRVDFASYGTPTGNCGSFALGGCNATNSKTIIEQLALNKNSFSVGANNGVFGDPCNGTVKNLRIQVHYKIANATASTFSCSDVGDNTVTLTVTDAAGNVSTQNVTVTVVDNIAPVVVTKNITVVLNAAGTATIAQNAIDNGSNDACGGLTYSVSKSTFDCSNAGANTVTLTVTDKNNNVTTGAAIVTVVDATAPVTRTKNITVALDATGNATITPQSIDNGSGDACGFTLTIDKTSFSCANRGNNVVTLRATDAAGNFSTATAIVTVIDNIAPTAKVKNIIIQLPASGTFSIDNNTLDNGSTDNCGIVLRTNSRSTFSCADVSSMARPVPVLVTYTVTDASGNSSSAIASVLVIDLVAPTAIAKNITVSLDANGNATITPQAIDNGSNDACGVTLSIDKSTFNCSNAGANTVTLTVKDASGNTSTATAIVTVEDHVAPVVITKPVTVSLDANGKGSITAAQIDNGSNDACGIRSIEVSQTNFDCGNYGANTVTLTVTDNHGNVSTATAVVTVEDHVAPVVLTQPVTVSLDANGKGSITATQIDNGSNDACGIRSIEVSKTNFDCSNYGANTVTLTVTDNHGNVSTATAVVTVEDHVAPVVITKPVTVSLNLHGRGSITAAQVDNGSNDACGIRSIEVSQTNFDCSNYGENTVTLTVTDNHGNVSTATAVVTVEDHVAPVVLTQPVTVSLDANGKGSITAAQIDNGSNDACGIRSVEVSQTNFDCSNYGANTVTLTVTDIHGNVSSATAVVTVEDHIAPLVITKPVTVSLNLHGRGSITAAQVDNGSNDACGIASIEVSKTTFDCSNYGENTVTLTVTDIHGNVSTATAVVTVEDHIAPLVITKSITISLDANGNASITAADINNGSSDACGIASVVAGKTTFTCADFGANTVTLTVTDIHGNVSTATTVVTVEDHIAPVVITKAKTVTLVNGTASITPADVNNGSSDACGIATMTVFPNTFACGQYGANTVTLTITDIHGNTSSATAVVTVVGNTPAPVITVSRTDNTNTGLNANTIALGYGAQQLTLTAGNTKSAAAATKYVWSPAAGLSNATIANPVFTPTAAGIYTFTVTATNEFGCKNTATVTITVMDVRCGPKNDKVSMCEVPPGNPSNAHAICVSANAVPAQLANGAYLGACRVTPPVTTRIVTTPVTTTPAPVTEPLAVKVEEKGVPGTFNVLKATVRPNPTTTTFVVRAETSSKENITIRIIDAAGRVHEMKNASANTDVIMGGALKAGAYFIEVRQGNNKQVVKGIKLN